jgi:hypothetical protein
VSRLWLAVAGAVVVLVGVAAFLLAGGTGGPAGTAASRLSSWFVTSGAGQAIGQLEADGASVRAVLAGHRGQSELQTVCAAMANDAEGANGQLPSPDAQVTQLLARAYSFEYDAAQSCYRAGAADRSLLATSAADRARARHLFSRTLALVRRLTGRTPSTTTTPGAPATTTGTGF